MRNQPIESMKKAFCTFCMGSYDPTRIASHLKRCSARVDDLNCIQTNGREHPMSFLLMVGIENRPEAWLCLEAHSQARFSDLELFIRQLWFPESKGQAHFLFLISMLEERLPEEDTDQDLRLEQLLRVKDRFYLELRRRAIVSVNLEVVGRVPTAIMHRPVDVAAFPLGSDGGRSPAGNKRTA